MKLISLNKCGNEMSHGQVTFLAIEMRNMYSSVNPSSLPTVVAHALRTADVVTHHDMAARTSVTTTRMFGRVTNLPSNNNESGFASQKDSDYLRVTLYHALRHDINILHLLCSQAQNVLSVANCLYQQ
ncbi:hypothetical protein Tco_0467948 [Tanacetum coccineum]